MPGADRDKEDLCPGRESSKHKVPQMCTVGHLTSWEVKEGSLEEVALRLRLGGGRGDGQWVPMQGKGMHRGPEVRRSQLCL